MKARELGFSLALLAFGGLLSAGLAEAVLRVYAHSSRAPLARQIAATDPYATKVAPHGDHGYRQRPGVVFPYPNGTRATANALGFRGPEVAVPKPAGTLRVVLLGESTTHGWGVNDSQTIDAYMRADLAARLPGRHVEVVNLAFDGYDTWQIYQRLLSDGLRLQPDVIVLNTGVNDVRSARYADLVDKDPRTLIWEGEMRRLRAEEERGGPTLWTRLKHWSYLARTPGILRRLTQAQERAVTESQVVIHPDAAAYFARNLRRIADTALALGVPVLFSTPPSVLLDPGAPRNMQPREYWVVDKATTQRYRDTLNVRLRALEDSLARAGRPVAYVPHAVPPGDFLDDCHPTPQGNRIIAAEFAAAALPFLQARE